MVDGIALYVPNKHVVVIEKMSGTNVILLY